MAAKNINCWLRFEFQSSHVIENCNPVNDWFSAAALKFNFPCQKCCAYSRAALIQELCLFQVPVRGIKREWSEAHSAYAQFNIKIISSEVQEATWTQFLSLWSCFISQAIWFWYLFILSAVTKVESLFINIQISTVALIWERRLLNYARQRCGGSLSSGA